MHQQAILVSGNVAFGAPGTLIGIEDVERNFTTTSAANSGIAYKCADPSCGVSVMAVITQRSKTGRKSSPTSYFRSKPGGSHRNGCTREPVSCASVIAPSATAVSPASPRRTIAPAAWIDPLSSLGGSQGSNSAGGAPGSSSPGQRSTKRTGGSGTSHGSSQRVEAFAKHWLAMNAQDQRSARLVAPWNPKGSYYDAFYPIAYRHGLDVSLAGQRIYVGMLARVAKTASEYVIFLQESNSCGASLCVLVPSSVLKIGPHGVALSSRLASLANVPSATQVFALGLFSQTAIATMSLSVWHPHYVYIA